MGFRKMDHDPFTLRDFDSSRKIAFNLAAVIILKELRVSPVKISLVQNLSGYGNFSTKSFDEKNRIRILVPDPGNNIFPDRDRNHVSCIAAKTIYLTSTPCKKDICHILPQTFMGKIKICQICPDYPPCSWNLNTSVLVPDKPFRMSLVEAGSPSRMVNGNIDKNSGIPFMDCIYQLDELL